MPAAIPLPTTVNAIDLLFFGGFFGDLGRHAAWTGVKIGTAVATIAAADLVGMGDPVAEWWGEYFADQVEDAEKELEQGIAKASLAPDLLPFLDQIAQNNWNR